MRLWAPCACCLQAYKISDKASINKLSPTCLPELFKALIDHEVCSQVGQPVGPWAPTHAARMRAWMQRSCSSRVGCTHSFTPVQLSVAECMAGWLEFGKLEPPGDSCNCMQDGPCMEVGREATGMPMQAAPCQAHSLAGLLVARLRRMCIQAMTTLGALPIATHSLKFVPPLDCTAAGE